MIDGHLVNSYLPEYLQFIHSMNDTRTHYVRIDSGHYHLTAFVYVKLMEDNGFEI